MIAVVVCGAEMCSSLLMVWEAGTISHFSAGEEQFRLAQRERHELTEQVTERITRIIRSLSDDQVDRGIDLARPMHCDSCAQEKSPAGSALYGSYKLCNDCLLDFTLALAAGNVDNVAQFMTKREEGSPPDLSGGRDRSAMSFSPKPARDTLMPSNEPC